MQVVRSSVVAVLLSAAAGTGFGLGGCGGAGSHADSAASRATASMPLDEVRRRDAEQAERKRLAAEESTPVKQDDALKQWMERVQADGLVEGDSAQGLNAMQRARRAEKSPLVFAAPPEPTREERSPEENPAALTDGTPGTEPAPSEASIAVPSVAASIEPQPATPSGEAAATIANSRPLSELTRLVMARAAGQSIDEARLGTLERSLTPEERSFYEQWKSLNQAVTGENAGDVTRLREAASKFAAAANGWAPLSIPTLALCSRVEGFGMYNELKRAADQGAARTYQFLAGRKNKFVVYCEVSGFAAKAASRTGRDGFEVELEQDLTLYAATKDRDVAAWRRTGQRVTDFSRNPRRDFFVVQIVDLPENLSVGAYTLKVRLIDRGTDSGAQAEALINIDIVADASALR